MDPSLSSSSDPHHAPKLTPLPPFSNTKPFVSSNQVFQPKLPPQTKTQTPPLPQASHVPLNPSYNHPPYSEMICVAITALKEPKGSSKLAISRYIERLYTGLPLAHDALLTHHLKTLKNNGVLALVKKSYKFAASHPPETNAVAAAASLEAPNSVIVPTNIVNEQCLLDQVAASGSASQPQKRGRGRPPKPKPQEEQQQEQPSNRRGRPRKNESSLIAQSSVMAGRIMKRSGKPPGGRAAGRQRKPKSVSSTASVIPYAANKDRRKGRPKRTDTSGHVASEGGEMALVAAPGVKRGRGRPPKIGGVISRLMKPKRGRGRPRNVQYENPIMTQDFGYEELKRKFDLFQEKAKEVLNVLKAEVTSHNQATVQAIKDLEGLTVMETVEPQETEGVQPEEAATNTEAETHGEEQGQKREG